MAFFVQMQASGKFAEIEIYDEIGKNPNGSGFSVGDLSKALKSFQDASQILVRINSTGGSSSDGLGIYGILKAHPARIKVLVEGVAASSAAVVAMAGDEIVMRSNAMMMIHGASFMQGGNAAELQSQLDAVQRVNGLMAQVFMDRSRQPEQAIRAMLEKDTWLTAEECKQLGFCDEVISASKVQAALNVTRFSKVPESVQQLVKPRTLPGSGRLSSLVRAPSNRANPKTGGKQPTRITDLIRVKV